MQARRGAVRCGRGTVRQTRGARYDGEAGWGTVGTVRHGSAALRPWANVLSLSRIALGVAAYLVVTGSGTAAGGAGAGAAGGALLLATGAAVALALTLAAGLTDYLDGVLARHAPPEATRFAAWFGRWIDAFTDFFFFLSIYSALLRIGALPVWLYAMFLAREGTMYLVVRPMAQRLALDHGARLAGKIKTVLQYAGVSVLLALAAAAPYLGLPGDALRGTFAVTLGVLVAVSVASLYWYWRPIFAHWPAGERPLPRQICLTVVGLGLLQVLLYGALAPATGVRWDLFLNVAAVFHVLIGGFLFWRHAELAPLRPADPSGAADRLGAGGGGGVAGGSAASLKLPNLLTLFRLSSIPTLTLLVAHGPRTGTAPVLVAVIALVFLTDLADGALARSRGQVTRIGGYLDSGSDYLVLLSLAVLLGVKGIMPPWLAWLLVARLVLHAAAMGLVVLRHGAGVVGPTTWGKVSVAAAMAVIGLELLAHLLGAAGDGTPPLARVLQVAEVAAALLIGISLVDKLRYFRRVMGARRAD